MTPQTQAEQKARELADKLGECSNITPKFALQELTLLIQKADERDAVEAGLPKTFYAGLPQQERVKFMWEQWHHAIKCLQELEIQNDLLKQKADALDYMHNILLRRTIHAVSDISDPEYPGLYILKHHNKVLGQGDSLLDAINQSRKEQERT